MTTTLTINGMICHSCIKLITMTIKSVGATPIVVELGSATFEGNPDQVKQAIEKLGYSASFIS